MKKITEFNLRRLHTSELGAFTLNLVATVSELRVAQCIPEQLVARLEAAHKQHNQSIGRKTDKLGTQRSKERNIERNNLILSIKGAIQMAKFRTPELREAAHLVEDALRKRGWNMHRQPFDAKTNRIKLLLADFERSATLRAAAKTIGCDELLILLEEANNKFQESEDQRRVLKEAYLGISSRKAKAELCLEIGRIFGYLNSVSSIFPEVEKTISYINLLIDPLAARIKMRTTKAHEKQQRKTGDTPEQPSSTTTLGSGLQEVKA